MNQFELNINNISLLKTPSPFINKSVNYEHVQIYRKNQLKQQLNGWFMNQLL